MILILTPGIHGLIPINLIGDNCNTDNHKITPPFRIIVYIIESCFI